jgi:hypothetical protein
MKHAPDWRRVLNECQKLGMTGNVDTVSGSSNSDMFATLSTHLKAKNFKAMRKWVVESMDIDTVAIFRGIYDNMYEHVNPNSIPQLVLILADYQYKDAFVADHELNTVACMTEIMANVEFN